MRATVALAATALGLAAACGESGGGERLTKEEYLRRADAICAEFDRKLEALPEPKTIEDVVGVAEDAKPIAAEGVGRLRALEPPEELEADVDRWLELNEKNVAAIDDLREAAAAGDSEAAQRVSAAAAENEQAADEVAEDIGLDECASDER